MNLDNINIASLLTSAQIRLMKLGRRTANYYEHLYIFRLLENVKKLSQEETLTIKLSRGQLQNLILWATEKLSEQGHFLDSEGMCEEISLQQTTTSNKSPTLIAISREGDQLDLTNY